MGVELVKWDFGSRLVPSGTALSEMANDMSDEIMQIMSDELKQIEMEKIQWMVAGPDYPKLNHIHGRDDYDFELSYPRKDDFFEISLSYCYHDSTFTKSLFLLRPEIKYWCDITRANKLVVFSSSVTPYSSIERLIVDLDKRNLLFENAKLMGCDETLFREMLYKAGLFDTVYEGRVLPGNVSIYFCNDYKEDCKKSVNHNYFYQELIRYTWHPDRFIDWCYDEDQKKSLYDSVE